MINMKLLHWYQFQTSSKKGVSANKPKKLCNFLLLIFPYFYTNKRWVSKFPFVSNDFLFQIFMSAIFKQKSNLKKKQDLKTNKKEKQKKIELIWHNWLNKKLKLRRNLFVLYLYNWINLNRRKKIIIWTKMKRMKQWEDVKTKSIVINRELKES